MVLTLAANFGNGFLLWRLAQVNTVDVVFCTAVKAGKHKWQIKK
jgi:hypothetical protein